MAVCVSFGLVVRVASNPHFCISSQGLPEAKEDHAVTMCEFARECLKKMKGLCKDLEIFLGPGTAALDLRIGTKSFRNCSIS